jgi:ribonucleotide monophosphatase NagD (HAD superfamily)
MSILVDLNGTIAREGKPIQTTIDYLKNVTEDIYVVSGSTEHNRSMYEYLLDLFGINYVELILSQEEHQSDLKYKLRVAKSIPNLTLAIDNNKKVISMYRNAGINAIFPGDIQ